MLFLTYVQQGAAWQQDWPGLSSALDRYITRLSVGRPLRLSVSLVHELGRNIDRAANGLARRPGGRRPSPWLTVVLESHYYPCAGAGGWAMAGPDGPGPSRPHLSAFSVERAQALALRFLNLHTQGREDETVEGANRRCGGERLKEEVKSQRDRAMQI